MTASAQKIALSLQTGFVFNTPISSIYGNEPKHINTGLNVVLLPTYNFHKNWQAGLLIEATAVESLSGPFGIVGGVLNRRIRYKKAELYAGATAGYLYADFRIGTDRTTSTGYMYGVQINGIVRMSSHWGLHLSAGARQVRQNEMWYSYNSEVPIRYDAFTFPIMVGVRYAF
ncbi:hypothetical protein CAP35_12775 [Chitinophagaceae bacterium IBVUCB1]|nr:hypothetical protein CAP35_12775 [Chitinophagaceae bacterium IBVUCB1]